MSLPKSKLKLIWKDLFKISVPNTSDQIYFQPTVNDQITQGLNKPSVSILKNQTHLGQSLIGYGLSDMKNHKREKESSEQQSFQKIIPYKNRLRQRQRNSKDKKQKKNKEKIKKSADEIKAYEDKRRAEKLMSDYICQEARRTLKDMNLKNIYKEKLKDFKKSNKSKKYFMLLLGELPHEEKTRKKFYEIFKDKLKTRLSKIERNCASQPYFLKKINNFFRNTIQAVEHFIENQIEEAFELLFAGQNSDKTHQKTLHGFEEAILIYSNHFHLRSNKPQKNQ